MDKELKKQIIEEKSLKCYLISVKELYRSHPIKGSIVFDMQSYEFVEDIDKKTSDFANYYIKKLFAKDSIEAKIYLIYYGDLLIENGISIEDFIIKNKDQIVGVAEDGNSYEQIEYVLPYYKEGTFYFDFAKFLELLSKNNIAFNITNSNPKDEFEITAKLTPKNYY